MESDGSRLINMPIRSLLLTRKGLAATAVTIQNHWDASGKSSRSLANQAVARQSQVDDAPRVVSVREPEGASHLFDIAAHECVQQGGSTERFGSARPGRGRTEPIFALGEIRIGSAAGFGSPEVLIRGRRGRPGRRPCRSGASGPRRSLPSSPRPFRSRSEGTTGTPIRGVWCAGRAHSSGCVR